MEIEVEEYVRTKFGRILKIDGPRDMGYIEKGNPYFRQQITKHSKRIIDLIEVGDYVNGYKVLEIRRNDNRILIGVYKDTETVIYKTLTNENVKTILTHEQFKKNAYRLEE